MKASLAINSSGSAAAFAPAAPAPIAPTAETHPRHGGLAADVKLHGDMFEVPDMVRLLTFHDPDGNALMVYQDISKRG